jgi:hypothetical protein
MARAPRRGDGRGAHRRRARDIPSAHRPRARAAATCRPVRGRDRAPRRKESRYGDARLLPCRLMRPHRRIGAGRARCLALCRARSASGEDRPRLRTGLLRTQSDPEAADCEPNRRRVGADQRHYLGGPPGVVPQIARPDLCCGDRRRACLLVCGRSLRKSGRRDPERS